MTRTRVDQLSTLKALGRKGFPADPGFGELSWLGPRKRPAMQQGDTKGVLPWAACEWWAEEADGGVLGALRVPGLDLSESPIVLIDNEGSVRVTGASLVDHFAHGTSAGREGGESLEPLLAFCRAHELPGPRSATGLAKLLKTFKLSDVDDGFPSIDAAKWRAALAASTPECPPKSAAPAAKPRSPGKASRPGAHRPLGTHVSGCVGPDGLPWFASPGEKRSPIVRFAGDDFEWVTDAPLYVSCMAAGQGALFVAGVADDKPLLVFVDGAWQSLALPEPLAYKGLHGNGKDAVFAIARSGAMHRIERGTNGLSRFVPVKKATARTGASVSVGADGALYVVNGQTRGNYAGEVTRIDAAGPKTLPSCPDVYARAAAVTATHLFVVDPGGEGWALALGAAKWTRLPAQKGIESLVGLPGGQAVGFGKSGGAFTLEPGGKSWKPGKLALKQSGGVPAVLATADGRVVLAGGNLHTRSKGDPTAEPQVFVAKTGKTVATAGAEAALDAQVKEQTKRFRMPW